MKCVGCGQDFIPTNGQTSALRRGKQKVVYCSGACCAKWRSRGSHFGEYVSKTNSCWIWMGKKNSDGYGLLWAEGKDTKAHRYAYELSVGPIPNRMQVCHSCDTPSCVNPSHLFLGTQRDNNADMVAKGRSNCGRGERNSHARLNVEGIVRIRHLWESGKYTQLALATVMGVSEPTIQKVVNRRTWKHVG